MHILKFTTGEISDVIILRETIGFNDSFRFSEVSVFLYESIGFRARTPSDIFYIDCLDTIGFNETGPILTYAVDCYETIGFYDAGDESLNVFCYDSIGFNDISEEIFTRNVECYETIGFDIRGYYEVITDEHDITFTWRTRTNIVPYGYGRAGYGDVVGYGDGNASNLVSFELQIWRVGGPESNRYLNTNPAGEYNQRLTKQVIPIVDTDDPDADATYTLTAADNKTFSGGDFTYELEAEIFTKDENGVYSFSRIILTNSLKINHED